MNDFRQVTDDYSWGARLLRAGSRGGSKGGGGGGGSSSQGGGAGIIGSESGPFKGEGSSTKVYDDTNFRESQYYTSYNEYFSNGRTYHPLLAYYLPDGFENEAGYTSQVYGKTYYDGYGYNFYSGEYGYYQVSPNFKEPSNVNFGLVVGVLVFVLSCFFIIIKYRQLKQEEELENSAFGRCMLCLTCQIKK